MSWTFISTELYAPVLSALSTVPLLQKSKPGTSDVFPRSTEITSVVCTKVKLQEEGGDFTDT